MTSTTETDNILKYISLSNYLLFVHSYQQIHSNYKTITKISQRQQGPLPGSSPPFLALLARLNPIMLVYSLSRLESWLCMANAFKWLCQYASSRGNRAYC